MPNKKNRDVIKYIVKHREMWDWLVKNPGAWKTDWPESEFVENNCYLCQYAFEQYYDITDAEANAYTEICELCPVVWPQQDIAPYCARRCGLYTSWVIKTNEFNKNPELSDLDELRALAETIRDIPLKTKYIH